jgi:hypothetical protein
VEHTAQETAALIASRGRWYVHTWNDLHLFPVMFLLYTHNISVRDAGVRGTTRGGDNDIMVYDKMRRKKPDASVPPDSLPEYSATPGST